MRMLLLCGLVPLAMTLNALAESEESLLNEVCRKFTGFDQNQDGQVELQSMESYCAAGDGGRLALMLVEKRLLTPIAGAKDLAPDLRNWAVDLAAEGFRAEVITVELAASGQHQDGRYVLALREFLRAAQKIRPIEGVMLTGHFPDAYLVRSINWRKKGDVEIGKKKYPDVSYLRHVPEPVARRADVVLSDLNGRWEDVYVQPKTRVKSMTAVFDGAIPEKGGQCVDVETGTVEFEDFFLIEDGTWSVEKAGEAQTVTLDDAVANHECGEVDAALPNPLSRPDLLVSRLDAISAARSPRKDIVDADGRHLLGPDGKPQALRFEEKNELPKWQSLWEADPVLERRLLAEYFQRNHAYRRGESEVSWRPSSIACDLPSGFKVMQKAATDWIAGDAQLENLQGKPNLVDVVNWLEYPAVLRTVRAHSSEVESRFAKTKAKDLDESLKGPAWSWSPGEMTLQPSLASACSQGQLNWPLLRSVWENGRVASQPSLYLHTGCDGISPWGARTRPYNDPRYGEVQSAEALLLFGNGLALLGRAKVFYDEPSGFSATLRSGKSIGQAWSNYYQNESEAENFGQVGGDIGRKRSYFWSLLGDYSLTLKKPPSAPKG